MRIGLEAPRRSRWRIAAVDALCVVVTLAVWSSYLAWACLPNDWHLAARLAVSFASGLFAGPFTGLDVLWGSWSLAPIAFLVWIWAMSERGSAGSRAALIAATVFWVVIGWYCAVGAYL